MSRPCQQEGWRQIKVTCSATRARLSRAAGSFGPLFSRWLKSNCTGMRLVTSMQACYLLRWQSSCGRGLCCPFLSDPLNTRPVLLEKEAHLKSPPPMLLKAWTEPLALGGLPIQTPPPPKYHDCPQGWLEAPGIRSNSSDESACVGGTPGPS